MSREKNPWERFCETGAIEDYLNYRNSVGFAEKQPNVAIWEVNSSAGIHRSSSSSGKASGGLRPPANTTNP